MLLRAKRISKRFGPNIALQDASFSVGSDEILGLIGPNGSGKTTLFECLAGLTPSDAGEVEFREKLLAPSHPKQALFYLPDGIRPWRINRWRRYSVSSNRSIAARKAKARPWRSFSNWKRC
jgi:ABC-type multidrug transport system ATPase subunit